MAHSLFCLSAVLVSAAVATTGFAGTPLEDLGEALFFDPNLSANRTQACATCHDPSTGFADPRETAAGRAVSLGDDGKSLGDRTAPAIGYVAFTPDFHRDDDGDWVGGFFWDGRAVDLEEQAGGPPLNPIEMGMADKSAVLDRMRENPAYVATLSDIFGSETMQDPVLAYDAMTRAIAAFERTAEFAPFDSKYDRYLRGDYEMTRDEELGRLLFFSEQFTNCNQCHQLKRSQVDPAETFSDYSYHNIGVPENRRARAVNGVATSKVDLGLLENPDVRSGRAAGLFKTPSLRNVAVTAPYMHNGVFEDLRTVVLFYNKYNTVAQARQINPETGTPWRMPEVPHTLSVKELTHGPALEDDRIDALVAFLKTLTDARYEPLLDGS
ncbi:cytochrome c peroxidase [Aliisedimentitalea scapharcae]|uniref:Cytochrome c peroxidase n=1 Tax=Aliisedimentitalea scapharcae TaxID=1524259 RepID=A0ABZ2XM97_9RHOB